MNQQTQRARFHPAKMTFSRIQEFKKSCIQQALRQHSVAYSMFGFLFKLLRNFNNFPMLRAYSRRSPTFLMSNNISYTLYERHASSLLIHLSRHDVFSLVHLQYIYIYKYTESQMLMKVLIVDLHPKVFEHVDPHPHPKSQKTHKKQFSFNLPLDDK